MKNYEAIRLKLKNGDIWNIYLPPGYDLVQMTLTAPAQLTESDTTCEGKYLDEVIANGRGRCWTVRRRD